MSTSSCSSSTWLSRIDIHGGYFDGAVTQRLISPSRLPRLPPGPPPPMGTLESLLDECAQHQILGHAVGAIGRERSASSAENGYFSARARVTRNSVTLLRSGAAQLIAIALARTTAALRRQPL